MWDPLLDSDRSSLAEGLEPQLVQGAQAYLRCLANQQTPSQEEADAWARFYLICDPLLRRFARSCGVFPGDIDDLVQTAWKDITRNLPAFHYDGQPGRLAAWLHLIVHSKANDLRRYRARHPIRPLPAYAGAILLSPDANPEAKHAQQEQQTRVRRVLREMSRRASPVSYQAFLLRYLDGRSIGEIARELRLRAELIRIRCCRMKQQFRRLYERDERNEGGEMP